MDGNLTNSQDVMDDFFADPAHKNFLIFRGHHPVFKELDCELCGDGTATGDWAQSFNETLAAFNKGKGRQVRAEAKDEEAEEAQDDGDEDAPDASTPKPMSAKTPKKGKGSSKKPEDIVRLLEGMKEMTGDVIAANPFKAIETANNIKKKAWDMLMTDNQSFCLDEWKDEKGDMKGDVLLEFWDEIGCNKAFALSFVEIAKAPPALRRRHLEREFRSFGRGTTE
ncbi:hypothetical protein KEM56_006456 [Ascosphaera pollenicola]|nr:hypothetical protein KEM56_006456 [Ascosphaera pollenicola]